MGKKIVIVECWQGEEWLAAYTFAVLESRVDQFNWDDLVEEAKKNLTRDGRAFPPHDGIAFRIVQ